MRSLTLAAALLAATCPAAHAQTALPAGPSALAITPTVPDAADAPYPGGAMTLEIDASDVQRGLFRVTQTIPLAAGTSKITLLFPQWLPGNHAPRGPLAELAELRFTVAGKPVEWRRDPVEVNAFHVDLPAGARTLTASFVHTSPLQASQGRITMTPEMLNLQWEKMSLYPAGHYVRQIRVRPSVTFPTGWTAATALEGAASDSRNTVSWTETDYETLVDSPIFAGRWFRRWQLGNGAAMSVVADEQDQLVAKPENVAAIAAVVAEGLALFGRPPFDRYEYLVALSNKLGGIGLEHLRSSENQMEPRDFIDWKGTDWDHNVLAHELVHAWNGKYRRPAAMWTPDYRQPTRNDLLWVYEGQTQFWGWVLAARSGLQQPETVLGMMATQAGLYTQQPGRDWRSIEDTTRDPIIAARKAKPFASLTRGEDYYNEAALVWLEADQIIRRGTGERKGLDDFARAFFAARVAPQAGVGARQSTYDFADVVAALNAVYPHDWAGFLRTRMEEPGQPAPLAGIEAAGYRLVWKAEPNPYDKGQMDYGRYLSLYHSLGLTVDRDGTVTATRWGGPAFEAGVVTGTKLIAANGVAYDAEKLKRAITDAKATNRPIELIVQRGDSVRAVSVPYTGGLRWPWLERTGGSPAPLDRLLAPRRGR